jgi:peptide/nickel transport system substrate-binding protein
MAIGITACAGLASCVARGPRRIVVAAKELPSRLDPVRASTPAEENACELVFDGLVNVAANDSGTASPVLGLAQKIVQDQDDRSLYHITLRPALWHDGQALDPSDVVASFAAYADPANRSPRREYLTALVSSMEAEGTGGVLVRFREPIAEFRAWYVLAFKIVPRLYKGSEMPSDRGREAGEAFSASPVGTGPFRFESRRKDELVFSAEPSSWRGAPASTGIVIRSIPASADRIRALVKGKVDMIADTSPLDRPELERVGDAMVQSYMPHAFYSAAINLREPILAKAEARRALASAIDRSSLVPGITDRGMGVQLNTGPFPDGLLTTVLPEYFKQGFPDRLPRDIVLAASLARSSGLAAASSVPRPSAGAALPKEGLPAGLRISVPESWGDFGRSLASGLAAQLGLAGISARADVLPDDVYAKAISAGDFDLALVFHEGYDNLFSGISELYRTGSPANETGVSDPRLDKLLASRDAAVEVTAWLRDTLELHDLVSEIVPYLPLFTIEKDLFYRGLRGVLIASDNPFLTAEKWSLAGAD